MAEKVFFGNVKEITNDYGTMFNIGVTKDDLDKLEFNEKGWANVSLKKGRSGKWYMEVMSPQQGGGGQQQSSNESSASAEEEDEMPF